MHFFHPSCSTCCLCVTNIPSRRTEYRRQLRERLLYHFRAYNYSISTHEKHTRDDKSQMSEGLQNMFIDDSLIPIGTKPIR
ncbi:hypothetical protein PM082_017847 [Marasmius tenuissimus]|nr:hypothetical protein PM082_017847 [Marasmius tenuissimus]